MKRQQPLPTEMHNNHHSPKPNNKSQQQQPILYVKVPNATTDNDNNNNTPQPTSKKQQRNKNKRQPINNTNSLNVNPSSPLLNSNNNNTTCCTTSTLSPPPATSQSSSTLLKSDTKQKQQPSSLSNGDTKKLSSLSTVPIASSSTSPTQSSSSQSSPKLSKSDTKQQPQPSSPSSGDTKKLSPPKLLKSNTKQQPSSSNGDTQKLSSTTTIASSSASPTPIVAVVTKKQSKQSNHSISTTKNKNTTNGSGNRTNRRPITKFTQLPCELLLHILHYFSADSINQEAISLFLLCKSITQRLNENSDFYKFLLIRTMERDLSLYRKYLQERIQFNINSFPFDIKSTNFSAKGTSQWKCLINKRECELNKYLHRKRQVQAVKNWKLVYEGYTRRKSIEQITLKVKMISKICTIQRKNENSLILILKLLTNLRSQLLKLNSLELRRYIVQDVNYGKRIKRGHSLFHQMVYLIGNYSLIRFDNEKIQQFIPYLKFLIGCCSENPLFSRNSYNYCGMDYVIRIGNYTLLSDLSNTYSDELKRSDLSTFIRKPLVFSMIKSQLSSSVIKNWIQFLEFPKLSLSIVNHQQMNLFHYLCHFVFGRGTQNFSQYIQLLKSELSREEVLKMLNQKDEELEETPLSKLLSYCENYQRRARVGIINERNMNGLYGIVILMSVHLGYDMSDEELARWNNLLENNDANFGNSLSRFYLSVETIELLRQAL